MEAALTLCAELTIRAEAWEVRRASEWLQSTALGQGVPAEQIARLDQCLDEALANVINHGGPTALAAPVHLQLGMRRSQGGCTAELLVADAGVAFDPCAVPAAPAPRPASLAEANPGGLGLLLIRSFSDDLCYRRCDDRNHLTISVSWVDAT